MDWDRDNVLLLIKLIRDRPVIWDRSCPNYTLKNKRQDAVEEIALLMGCSVKAVNTKWASLRNQFAREQRNATKGMRTGSGENAIIYTTKWYAFKELESLMNSKTPKEKFKNLDYSGVRESFNNLDCSDESETSNYLDYSDPVPARQPCGTSNINEVNKNLVYKEATEKLNAVKRKREANDDQQLSFNADDSDDLKCFGLYVAAHLKKYSRAMQCKAKFEINKLLYKLDMESLQSSDCHTSKDFTRAECSKQQLKVVKKTPATNFMHLQPLIKKDIEEVEKINTTFQDMINIPVEVSIIEQDHDY